MDPRTKEIQKKQLELIMTILEGQKAMKEYQLETIKGQREIREDLRNLDSLRALKKTA